MPRTRITPESLTPGMRLERSLFTRQGIKLLSRGVVLTDEMCRMLRRPWSGGLYMADSVGELRTLRSAVESAQQQVGAVAQEPVVAAGGRVLVEQGEPIEPHHADAIALGVADDKVTQEARRQRDARLRIADQFVAERATAWERIPRSIPRGDHPLDLSARNAPGWPPTRLLIAWREERVAVFRGLLARLLSGLPTPVAPMAALIDELIHRVQRHPERFAQIALLAPRQPDHIPDHCYTTACLSVAIAAHMGWSREHVLTAGLAGLLADVGMGAVPLEIRNAERPLNEIELNRVRRHPAHTVALLEAVQGLPEPVRLAAYQHHEREDGQGYPCGARRGRIYDAARVVAVADAFAAATSPRPYRAGRRPYDALEEIINLSALNKLAHPAVRALVKSTGLFPIGSHVRLSTGEPAVVVGVHVDQIDRPIVAPYTVERGELRLAPPIDLAALKPWELHVIRAIDPPDPGSGLSMSA